MKEPVAVELFSAGSCNMACNYCYIPKHGSLKRINDKIIEKMKDGTFIQNLKDYYGEDLRIVSLWGTEPTTNMDVFNEYMLDSLVQEFPNLEGISFSSNMLENTDQIIELARKLSAYQKNFYLDVQLSDDGLWFTDANRHEGAGQTIRENIRYLLSELDKLDLSGLSYYSSHFKPTLTIENMKELMDKNMVLDWFRYFEEEYFDFFVQKIKNKQKIKLGLRATPTLVCPGDYTKEDAHTWRDYLQLLHDLSKQKPLKYMKGSLNNYTGRLSRIITHQRELGTKPYMFTCSAGDSQMGINTDNSFGMCHRMFYTKEDDYIEECDRKGTADYQMEKFLGTKYSSQINADRNRLRLEYTQRAYHDFWRHKLASLRALIIELARAGEIDEIFLDEDASLLFSMLQLTGLNCQADNLAGTGSQFIKPKEMIVLWGSGAFAVTFKDYLYWHT